MPGLPNQPNKCSADICPEIMTPFIQFAIELYVCRVAHLYAIKL